METPQTEANIPQEQETGKKRSPWLVILIIFLIVTMCCCIMGVILCRGTSMLPDFLDRYLEDIPGFENGDYDIWGLVEDFINDSNFDLGNFDPEDFLPEDFDIPDLDEFGEPEEPVSGSGICPSQPTEYVLMVDHTWDFSINRDTENMKVDGWTDSNSECTVIIEGSQVNMPNCVVPISNEGFIQTDAGPCSITAYGYLEITLDNPRCEAGVVVARIIDVIDPDMESGGEMICPGSTQTYFPFYPFSNSAAQFRLQPGGDILVEEADPDVSNQFKYHKEWMLVPVE